MKFANPALIIFVLIIVAAVLGYAIYNQLSLRQEVIDKTPQPLPTQIQPSPVSTTLTEDEQTALKTPGVNSTEDERQSHLDAAVRAAKYANTLNISGCRGNPVVLRVGVKQNLIVENPDSEDHTIVVDADHSYTIPANGKMDIVIDFGKGGGLYGYGCDSSQSTSGLFLVGQ